MRTTTSTRARAAARVTVRAGGRACDTAPTTSNARRGTARAARAERLYDQPAEWMADGLCAQADPEAWFPEPAADHNDHAGLAKQLCAGCPVRSECLEYALATDQRFGIWGGLSEKARRDLRKTTRRQQDAGVEGGAER